jgi:hypothetical protein
MTAQSVLENKFNLFRDEQVAAYVTGSHNIKVLPVMIFFTSRGDRGNEGTNQIDGITSGRRSTPAASPATSAT